jgi:hypothetical protein
MVRTVPASQATVPELKLLGKAPCKADGLQHPGTISQCLLCWCLLNAKHFLCTAVSSYNSAVEFDIFMPISKLKQVKGTLRGAQ